MMQYLDPQTELRPFLKACMRYDERFHLACLTAVCHGLRVSEVRCLSDADIDKRSLTIKCNRLKNSLQQMQALHISSDPLFDESPLLDLNGRLLDLSRQRIDQIFKAIGKNILPPEKCHFHALKHTAAILAWKSTQSLGLVQTHIGHKNIKNTLVYLRDDDSKKVSAAVANLLSSI